VVGEGREMGDGVRVMGERGVWRSVRGGEGNNGDGGRFSIKNEGVSRGKGG